MAQRKRQQSLVGKLLLSTALVAVTFAYGWWQRHERGGGPDRAIPQILKPPAAPSTARGSSAVTARAEPTAPATKAAPAAGSGVDAAAQIKTPAPTIVQPGQHKAAAASILPLTAMAALRMYQPPPPQQPLPLITGTPASGVSAPIPQGAHLRDGDYLSDPQQFEWGDLQVKILVHGGQITGAQLVQYPDHRAESLQISQMASPLLNSEVIRTQQAKVDIVSSATDTSYVYRDAIANAIFKATRYHR